MRKKQVPLKEILFAAKMGFLSRAMWEDHFSKRSRTRNLRVWRQFVVDKYFEPHKSIRLEDILVLGELGRFIVESSGGEVVRPPHINQIDHDEIVSRIALKILSCPEVAEVKTEGELRRKYMGWIKTTRAGREAKLPDLLVELKGPRRNVFVALEIELSRKNPERYRKVMNSYASQKTAERVVFISAEQTIFDRLSKAMKDTQYPSWDKPIGFSKLDGWLKSPMTTDISFSDRATTLEKLSSIV